MSGDVIGLLAETAFDFGTLTVSSESVIEIERAFDVSSWGDVVAQVRCHAFSAGSPSNSIRVEFHASAPTEEDPSTEFIGPSLGVAEFVGGSTTAPALAIVPLDPTGACIRVRVIGVRGAAAALAGTLSIDFVARDGISRRHDLAETLRMGNVTGGEDIVLTTPSAIRGADGGAPEALLLRGGNALVTNVDGAAVTIVGGGGAGNGTGGDVFFDGGAGGTTGKGGAVFVTAGAGGTTAGGGGTVELRGGAGQVSGAAGGAVLLEGGASGATAVGGAVEIRGGSGGTSSGNGGIASLLGGDGTASAAVGGIAEVVGGTGGSSAAGGQATITGGTGGTTSGAGGAVLLTGGLGRGSTAKGGAVELVGGDGGTSAAGSDVTLRAGRGGTSAGAGGVLTLEAGAARATGAAGGEAKLTGGAGVGSAGNGGNVIITAGSPGNGNVTQGSSVVIRAHETDYTESSNSYGGGVPGVLEVNTHGSFENASRMMRTFSFTSSNTTARNLRLTAIGTGQVLIVKAHLSCSYTATDGASAWTFDGIVYENFSGTVSIASNVVKTDASTAAAGTIALWESSGIVHLRVTPASSTAARFVGWIEWQISPPFPE
jgi:hypothetical protein